MEREKNQKEHHSCLRWHREMPCKQVRLTGRLVDQDYRGRRKEWYLPATEKLEGRENRRDQRCCLQAQLQVEPCMRQRNRRAKPERPDMGLKRNMRPPAE